MFVPIATELSNPEMHVNVSTPDVSGAPAIERPLGASHQELTESMFYNGATAVLFLSVFLRAHLFINASGHIHINPTCGPAGKIDEEQEMLKLCRWDPEGRRAADCRYASRSGKYLMAMDRRTGYLKTVPMPVAESEITDCALFREEVVETHEDGRVTVVGCADSDGETQLKVKGKRLNRGARCPKKVGPFKQIGKNTTTKKRARMGHFMTGVNRHALDRDCRNLRGLWKQCGTTLQASYPLHDSNGVVLH